MRSAWSVRTVKLRILDGQGSLIADGDEQFQVVFCERLAQVRGP